MKENAGVVLPGDYEVQIISKGEFLDQGYKVTAIVFRVNDVALFDFISSGIINDDWTDYEDAEENGNYRLECSRVRDKWEKKIKELLGWYEETGSVTRNVGEIFTAVFMDKEPIPLC